MPFQSVAQRRMFHAKVKAGEMEPSVLERWDAETPRGAKLPEHKKRKRARGIADLYPKKEK